MTAKLRYLNMSPRKVRRVARLLPGLPVGRAEAELSARSELAAKPLKKLLQSAVANARSLTDVAPEQMHVLSCRVDQGPTLKRFRPRSRGMVHPIGRRTSHVFIALRMPDTERKQKVEVKAATSVPQEEVGEEGTRDRDRGLRPTKKGEEKKKARLRTPKIGRRIFRRKSV
ncbi:MAG: 50S ribosomal protein L22 [Armatimonadetes bacterium]|nr:50S ribosomal protein L22 [Armatimonadota bacterium]